MSKAAELAALIGSGQAQSNRNTIINGAMNVAQRGTSTASLSSGNNFVLDRFKLAPINAGTWTMSQSTTVPTSQGFSHSLKLDCTTADTSFGSTDALVLQQLIEGQNVQQFAFGTSDAKSVTVSFWIRSNKTGTYTLELQQQNSSNGFYQNAKTFTISSANTWEKKETTFVGNTSQNIINTNAVGFYVTIWLGTGTSRTSGTFTNGTWHNTNANRVSSSNVNLADSTNNELYLTGLQLEIGDVATAFEHEDFGTTLRKCQRYFVNNNGQGDGGGINMARSVYANAADGVTNFPVEMRANPTITFFDAANTAGALTENGAANGRASTALYVSRTTVSRASSSAFSTSAGAGYHIQGTYKADAEL